VSRDLYFFEDSEVQNSTFWISAYGFHNFRLSFLWRKSKIKFQFASIKSLTNCEIPSGNPLQRACSGFLIAACAFKSYSETRLSFWKCSESRLWMYSRKNWPMRVKESLNRNLMCLTEQLSELVSVFKEASKNFILIFL
jgi:hypothetical protein